MARYPGAGNGLKPGGTYYHGSRKADSIRVNGLRPNRNDNGEEPQKFAFLARDPGTAKEFAQGGKVLEVKPPRRIERKFRTDLGEYIRSPDHIPRQYIKEYKGDD